jgi:hypothetical protein
MWWRRTSTANLLPTSRRDDFVLRDNGQEEKIALFALEEASQTATAVPFAGPVDVHQQARAGDRGGDRVSVR